MQHTVALRVRSQLNWSQGPWTHHHQGYVAPAPAVLPCPQRAGRLHVVRHDTRHWCRWCREPMAGYQMSLCGRGRVGRPQTPLADEVNHAAPTRHLLGLNLA